MKLFYSEDYTRSAYGFDTTRKAKWIADSLRRKPIKGVEIEAPRLLDTDEIELDVRGHAREYLNAVRNGDPRPLAQSNGFPWDPGIWTMVHAQTSGAVVAAETAFMLNTVAGSLSSGLHHARRDNGSAFCTFNGLALGAMNAVLRGARNVLILDVDAHCGGGTHSMISWCDRITQIDVSTSMVDSYKPVRMSDRLFHCTNGKRYLKSVSAALASVGNEWDLCIYNAGMDPHEDCFVGGMDGITAEVLERRERMVFDWCAARGIPVAFVLAGGYTSAKLTERSITDLHRLTIKSAASAARHYK